MYIQMVPYLVWQWPLIPLISADSHSRGLVQSHRQSRRVALGSAGSLPTASPVNITRITDQDATRKGCNLLTDPAGLSYLVSPYTAQSRVSSLTTAPADDGRPNATGLDQNAVTVYLATSPVNGQELLFQLWAILPRL